VEGKRQGFFLQEATGDGWDLKGPAQMHPSRVGDTTTMKNEKENEEVIAGIV